jgi:predicted CXXCH cytochrome family protein
MPPEQPVLRLKVRSLARVSEFSLSKIDQYLRPQERKLSRPSTFGHMVAVYSRNLAWQAFELVEEWMDGKRWLIFIGIALAPLLAGMATQQPAQDSRPNVGGAQAKVTNPHGPISIPCQNCHSYTSWKPVRSNPEFNHDQTGYPLRGMHEKVGCTKCHTSLVFKNVSSNCADCHADIHRRQFGTNCASCHTVKGWNVSLDAIKNHQNRFPLVGAHAIVECDACHKGAASGQFTGLSTACYSCHQKDFQTPIIDHISAGFPTTCESCHTMDSWFGAKFDHLKYTGYALTGMHATLACVSCHANNVFKGTPADCFTCHTTDFTNSNNPPHVQIGLPHDCGICHSTTNWLNASFDHAVYAHYPLTGAHATVTCAQCHTNNNYASTPTACYSCHQADFTGTKAPSHVASGFPTDCSVCHTTSGWSPSTFNHSAGAFPLTGAHITVACASCHTNNNYTTVPTACYGCHQKDFTGTTNPPHATANFPTDCTLCHNTTAWTGATFNHNNTSFPLTGAHTTVACALCHTNNNYTSLPTNCYGCHTTDFNGTTNPAHVAAGFPTDCTLCHSTANWTSSTFNHASVFPLTGFHATMPCAQCHTNNNYTTLATNCYGCHTADFTGTNNPSHVTAAFPTTCDTCHTTTNWTSVTFNHAVYANYALTGFHATLTCVQCHANNNYTATSTACYSCHQADFTGTTNPAHVSSGFPTDCSICHSTTAWNPSTFNHATTAFPLTGFHATMACATCHTNNNYTTLPTNCYGCHTADWNGTNNPAHASAGFPTTCDTCHTTTDWTGATFNHANTPFPLTGAHVTVACTLCHIKNVFAGTPTDCYSCHTKDFTGTTNPNHVTAAWPTTCVTCHTTTAWLPATLPTSYHTFFPENHGNAKSVCATCHTNTSDYSVFSCTATCHGSGNSANFHHPNTNGYVYNSVNCYACHKNGGGG